jgi:hypothetical protein
MITNNNSIPHKHLVIFDDNDNAEVVNFAFVFAAVGLGKSITKSRCFRYHANGFKRSPNPASLVLFHNSYKIVKAFRAPRQHKL